MWLPHTTVAAIVVRDDKFLMVHEDSDGEIVFNQPAGHLDPGETLIEACIRETLEETKWKVNPSHYLGVNQYTAPSNGVTYIRHTFIAEPVEFIEDAVLDEGIIEALWLSYEEIKSKSDKLRSPVVLGDIDRYLSGTRIPLNVLTFY